MSDDVRRNEIGEFLKARRAQLKPSDLDLADVGPARRVPGLRREEVAQLAAISTDYYTRIEQGRIHATASVLAAVAQALRLDDDQRAYLRTLAGMPPARPRRRKGQKVRPLLQRLLDQVTDSPALILGRRMDVLAWNPMAAALFTDFALIPEAERNWARLVFTHPDIRRAYAVDWESTARSCVATLRMQTTRYLDDPALSTLIGDLSIQDEDFRRWWASHQVTAASSGVKTIRHAVAGDITLDWENFVSAADDEQCLSVMSAAPGTPAHDALAFLASWTAEHHTDPATEEAQLPGSKAEADL
jgi:transcriptional regulator with XRE-family HTH domain